MEDMIGFEDVLSKRWELERGDGSKMLSHGGRVIEYTTLNGRGLEDALERRWGLEGVLKKR